MTTDDDVIAAYELYSLCRTSLTLRERHGYTLPWPDDMRRPGLPDHPTEADCQAFAARLRELLEDAATEPTSDDWVRVGVGADPAQLIQIADARARDVARRFINNPETPGGTE
jgi:hypothetical protein